MDALTERSSAALPLRERRHARAVGFVPAESVLAPPPLREGAVPRPELLRGLLQDGAPVLAMTAPPGYGKTTLLRQWAEVDPRPFAWLSLRDVADDAATLLTYVVLALQRVEPVDTGPLPAPGDAGDLRGTVLPRLGRAVARRRRRFVLVLDDVDAVRDDLAVELLRVLADHVPAGSRLVLAGTRVPSLLVARLRTEGRVSCLEAGDLLLGPAEAAQLLAAEGVGASPRSVTALVELTAGWAAGLYLAALAVADDGGDDAAVQRFTRSRGEASLVYLRDFVRDQLLARLPPRMQDFVLRTSILDELTPGRCQALLARDGTVPDLREVVERDAFLRPVPDRPGRYRYPRLVAEVLRSEVRRREPELERQLHHRASLVCAERGDRAQALAHAVAGGDVERAGELLWRLSAGLLAAGRRDEVERWLREFPRARLLSVPWWCLVAAACAAESGEQVQPWLEAAERGAQRYRNGRRQQLSAGLATLRAAVGSPTATSMLDEARRAQSVQEPDDGWRALAGLLEGVAAHLLGDRAAARRSLESSAFVSDALGLPATRALALAQLGLLDVEQQDWPRAEARIRRARQLLQSHGLDSVPTTAPVESLWALVQARWGQAERARASVHRTRHLMATVEPTGPWFSLQARVVLARSLLLIGDAPAARTLLTEAQRLLRDVPDAPVLREWTQEAWRAVEEPPLMPPQGKVPLTSAELRVLQFLPSYLSFEEIGRRLSLSRNTVKTQAIAAYRKLGVSSRAEAVERGRALGLVGWSAVEGGDLIREG